MHPRVERESLSKDLKLNLQGQGGYKRRMMDFKKIPIKSDHTLRWYATLCMPSNRRDASMQDGHHLHTCTTLTSQGVLMVKALLMASVSRNSNHSLTI